MDLSELCEGDVLQGQTATYTVQRFLGEGSFGMVVECLEMGTNERVAVKMLKDPAAIRKAEEEVQMLLRIRQLDSERCNVVFFKDCFQYMGLTCLVFEMLDISLWDLLTKHTSMLPVGQLRAIALQLLIAFHALKHIDVIHADLKPDNVMLTHQPYRVKLIDFGMALTSSEVEQGVIRQPAAFRAPEVTLGCVYDFPIDMWGLGCTLAHLLVGKKLFPCCGYQSMKMMVDLMGMPPDDMLNNGRYTQLYFTKEEDGRPNPTWRLLTPDEYSRVNRGEPGEPAPLQNDLTTLDDLLNSFVCQDEEQAEDVRMCMDLLKRLLSVDPRLRVTPMQALQHPFITMTHLSQDSVYSTFCRSVMQHVYPTESDAHQEGQPPESPDDTQSKDSSPVSLDSAEAPPEVVSARAAEPLVQDFGFCEADSSEEQPLSQRSTDFDQDFHQRQDLLGIHHLDEDFSSSEGQLPHTADVDSSRVLKNALQEKCNRGGESKPSALQSPPLQAATSRGGDSHVMDVSSGEGLLSGDWTSITEQIESPHIKDGCGSRGLGCNSEGIEMGRAETPSKNPKPSSSLEKCGSRIIAKTAALLPSPDSVTALDYKASQLAKPDTVPMSSLQRKDEKWDRQVDVDPISRAVVIHRRVQGELDLVFVKRYTVSIRWLLSWLQSGVIARGFVILVWDPGGKESI